MKRTMATLFLALTLSCSCGAGWAATPDEVKDTLQQNYIYCLINADKTKADPAEGTTFKLFIDDIVATMKLVDEVKLPDSTVIEGTTGQQPSTIGEIRKMIPVWQQIAAGGSAAATQADESKWAPFTSVLEGDRLAYFNRTHRTGSLVYTSGGKLLENPEDFQKANVWYTYTFDRETIPPTWEVTARRFKGNSFMGEPVVTNGEGERPPTSAYK